MGTCGIMVEALCCKPEGCGFNSQLGYLIYCFQLT
jgi:hypothetical protein